jgi:5-(carboxyamino)imidazole ribonucleotide mutase
MSKIGIIMGSTSDLPVMQGAIEILKGFDIEVEVDIVSAHRTPDKLFSYGKNAHTRGISVIIAGAGGAAHLPGMIASLSPLPVIGVPVKSSNSIDGWDSILSILQMPGGVPVATVALNGAQNAGILAAQIIGTSDKCVLDKVLAYKKGLKMKVEKGAAKMKDETPKKLKSYNDWFLLPTSL